MSKFNPKYLSDQQKTAIWENEQHTPTDKTSSVSRRGGFTAVNQQYQLERATNLWGPYGDCWGMDVVDTKFITNTADQTCVWLHAKFYYPSPVDGSRVEFDVINDTPLKMGDETAKKLWTNTRSKALSYLGFSSDVYSGFHDSPAYKRDEAIRESDDMMDRILSRIANARSAADLKKVADWSENARKQRTVSEQEYRKIHESIASAGGN